MNSEIDIQIRNLKLEILDLKTILNSFIPDDIPWDDLRVENVGGERSFKNTLTGISIQIERINIILVSIPSGYRHPYELKNVLEGVPFPSDEFGHLPNYVKRQLIEVEKIENIIHHYGKVEVITELNIPEQSASLKLGFSEGKISILDSSAIDNAGNEKALIEALHGPLLGALKSAENTLNQGNKAYGFLADNIGEYFAAVDKPIDTINFGEVFLKAKKIQSALTLAKQYESSGEYPELPSQARIDIEAVLEAHKPFMQASEIGAQIVANSEHYDKTPAELKALRNDFSELKILIENSTDLIDGESIALVSEALDVSNVKQNVKSMIFASRVAKNFGIVALNGAFVTMLGASALAIPIVGEVAGPAIVLAGGLAVKKSASMEQLLTDVKTMGRTSQEAANDTFNKFKVFVSKHATLLSRTTMLDDDGKWFKKGLKILNSGPVFVTETISTNASHEWETRSAEEINQALSDALSHSPGYSLKAVSQFFSEMKGKKVEWDLMFDGSLSRALDLDTNTIACQLSSGGHITKCTLFRADMENLLADDPKHGSFIRLRGTLRDIGNLYDCVYLGVID